VTAVKRRKCEGGCGRVCAKKRPQSPQDGRTAPQGPGVPPALSRRLTATNTAPLHPGQTELPLAPMQPTLWSL
jgi:hypothetical protein